MATEPLPGSFCDAGGFAESAEAGLAFSAGQGVLPVGGPSGCHGSAAFAATAGEAVVVAGADEAGAGVAAGEIGVRGPRGFVPAGIAATAANGGRMGFAVAGSGRRTDECVAFCRIARQVGHAEANLHGPRGILRIPSDLARVFGVVAVDVFGTDGNGLPGGGRRQAIFDRQAIQLGIKLLDAESGRDLAGFAADGRKLDLGWNRIDDHDQLGRMRALRSDLAGTVERTDIEPVFAVDARPEEEISLLVAGPAANCPNARPGPAIRATGPRPVPG